MWPEGGTAFHLSVELGMGCGLGPRRGNGDPSWLALIVSGVVSTAKGALRTKVRSADRPVRYSPVSGRQKKSFKNGTHAEQLVRATDPFMAGRFCGPRPGRLRSQFP